MQLTLGAQCRKTADIRAGEEPRVKTRVAKPALFALWKEGSLYILRIKRKQENSK